MSVFDTFMSDTVGVGWRAVTGSVDPWTKQEIIDQSAAEYKQAGMSSDVADQQAKQDVTDTLKTFTLGGDDPTGADPSQAKFNIPSWQAIKDTFHSDDGSGCSITNIAGCMPTVPSWVYWA